MIEVDPVSVRFSHPLVRDALVSSTTPELRRRIHRSLAVALEATGHRDQATVHFGESAEGPDDEIADRLEALSVQAAHRGDHGVASTLAWRAGALRTDRDRRARDWLRSGTEAATAGITYGARLEAALEETDDPSLIAEIHVTRARLATLAGDPDFAAELLGSHGETIIAASPFLGAVLTALAGSCAWMRADGHHHESPGRSSGGAGRRAGHRGNGADRELRDPGRRGDGLRRSRLGRVDRPDDQGERSDRSRRPRRCSA